MRRYALGPSKIPYKAKSVETAAIIFSAPCFPFLNTNGCCYGRYIVRKMRSIYVNADANDNMIDDPIRSSFR